LPPIDGDRAAGGDVTAHPAEARKTILFKQNRIAHDVGCTFFL